MARKIGSLAFEAILVTILLFVPRVICDDTVPIPSDKSQVNSWFTSNVQAASGRKDLDPALATAESKPPRIIKVNADGSGEFKTITDALNSIPDKNTERVVLKIGGGNYTEKIKADRGKPFITFYGDPKNVPNIVFGGDAAKYGTVESATLAVESDYFMGLNINVINTTPKPDGRPGAQAVALRTSGDKGAYYNVKAYGFQDTLCDDKGLHFYKDCYFEGTVDFIFGNAKSIYLNTEAHIVPGETEANVITAHARDNPANDVGYSFVQCSVTGTGKKSFLGRTWRSHPTVVFSYTEISDVIDPAGWSNAGKTEFEKTAFFGEFNNKGPGAALTGRPAYVKKLTEVEAKPFLSLSYIQGSKWLLPPITI